MALKAKLIRQVEVKSSCDVFHELLTDTPHHISNITPEKIQGCNLHEGQFGNVGSVVQWNYTHDGKEQFAKEVIEAVDEENQIIIYKLIEGDLLELFKTFTITLHTEIKGSTNLVTWTFDYEKLNETVEDPTDLMEYTVAVSKDIENHHLNSQVKKKK